MCNESQISCMHPEEVDKRVIHEFILLAFPNINQILLFVIVQVAYVVSLTGNFFILLLIGTEPMLHTPMYFFISVLAALEVIYMSAIHPRFLASIISTNKRISFIGCFVQMFVIDTLGISESYLLAFMAIDRDLAINHPLRYSAIMTKTLCIILAVLPWIIGIAIMMIVTILTANLDFCGHNEIDHFYCDPPPMHVLACSDTFVINVITSTFGVIACAIPFFIIIRAYLLIILTISKIKTAVGKRKAFSTCSAHLVVAILYYITISAVYIEPNGKTSKKYITLMFALISPTSNPFIYTLRNKDVKEALRKSKLFQVIQNVFGH